MSEWRRIIETLRREATPVILVSVDSIVGSTPREAGARMLVTAEQHFTAPSAAATSNSRPDRIARDQLALGDARRPADAFRSARVSASAAAGSST